MENVHVQRRSASHGSLRSSYRSHARPPAGYNLPRRPLRSVNENASLLPSPGPLESMLKTTTETGDIGTFSIKPIAPAVTIHHYARSRPGLDAGSIFRADSRASDEVRSRSGPRRRGSERDTNSEIISMYGSEGPPSSFSSSLSPGNEGSYRRSYSLTTCGSRHLSSHKSSGTLQSQSSTGFLQRPRSPFPYPTRLKRPGVRPSSPALTNTGFVDYSRMVEIDRISYRTVHGSYKPTLSQPQQLAPPLPFRSGVNQSMPYLPCTNSLLSQTGTALRGHAYSQWSNGPLNRTRRPSTDHSVRSSSLTSVIDMYYRPLSNSEPNLECALRSTGSFYYDYTEGFGSPDPQANDHEPTSAPPVAPIPQRVSSLARALILRDETKARLDAVLDVSVKDSSDSSGDDGRVPASDPVNDIKTLPSQRMDYRTAPSTLRMFPFEVEGTSASGFIAFGAAPSMFNPFLPCVDTENMQPHLTTQDAPRFKDIQPVVAQSLPEESSKESNNERKVTEDQELAAQSETPLSGNAADEKLDKHRQSQPELPEEVLSSHSEPQTPSGPLATRKSALRRVSSHGGLAAMLQLTLRNPADSSLSDLAALVSSFERIAKSPFTRNDKGFSGPSETADKISLQSPQQPGGQPVEVGRVTGDESAAKGGNHTELQPKRPFFKGHRRNQALARISMTSLRSQPAALASNADVPLAAPKPVSPTRLLKVKNSIPQLMKALPSLPNDALPPSRETSDTSADDLRFPVKFSPFQLEVLATPLSNHALTALPHVEAHESSEAMIELHMAPAGSEPEAVGQQAPKNGAVIIEGMTQEKDVGSTDQQEECLILENQGDQEEPSPSKRRLRLRVPRTGPNIDTTCFREDQNGTVRRRRSFEQSIFAELSPHLTEGLLTPVHRGRCQSSTVYQRRGRQFALFTLDGHGDGNNQQARRLPTARVSRDGYLHERDIPLAHPVGANLLRQSTSTDGFDLSDSRSFSSDLTFIRPRILRKKLSNLRIRLTKSRLNFRDRVNMNTERRFRSNGIVGSTGFNDTVTNGQQSKNPPNQSKRVARKMGRWIRRAVRICVKGRRGEL